MIHQLLPAAVLTVALTGGATAQGLPALSYGIGVTSNYIDNGTSQSDDHPAVQGYVEASRGRFYGGVWASTVDIDDDNVEFDLYAGVRESFGDLEVDFSYYRYLYDDSGDCCGEFILVLAYPMADIGSLGAEFDYDPVNDTKWVEAQAAVGFLTDYEVGGAIGTDFGSEELGDDDKVAWNVGVSRGLGEIATVDLRYHDSNYDPGRAVVSIGVDF